VASAGDFRRRTPSVARAASLGQDNKPTREETVMRIAPLEPIAAMAVALLLAQPAAAQKKYDPGVSDTEIRLGQTMPYSGPASSYGAIGKAEAAFFKMINDQGGVNGRKIDLISLDDGYSPPRTVEQTRKLVEQEQVLLIFSGLGTASNTAVQKYLNEKHVPQLFVATGATKFGDPEHFPWTMGWQPTYQTEGRIFARYLLKQRPDAKIGILYQNDDYGRDYVKGLKDGLGARAAAMIVNELSYEVTDTTIDSQIVTLQASGADVFYDVTTPRFAAQAIRKTNDIGWKALHLLNGVSASLAAVAEPAGLDKTVGVVTRAFLKDSSDPQWKDDKDTLAWFAWMRKYYPEGDVNDAFNVFGYATAMTLVQVLKQCGDDLSRENVMKQAASLDLALPMLLPGVKVTTGPSDFFPIKDLQLARFDGKIFAPIGEVISGE
jgi:branched-chain amino acid transport system substrate-binding protein